VKAVTKKLTRLQVRTASKDNPDQLLLLTQGCLADWRALQQPDFATFSENKSLLLTF